MRTLRREQRSIYVSQPLPPREILDDDGNDTGTKESVWDEPTQLFLNAKPVTDELERQAFGTDVKNILKVECTPFDSNGYEFVEKGVAWIGISPNGILSDGNISSPMNCNYTIKQVLPTGGQITIYFEKIAGTDKA